MRKFLDPIIRYKSLWLPLVGILMLGVLSNIVLAGFALLLYMYRSSSFRKNQFLLIIFLSSCILASNLTPSFSFAKALRFLVMGISLLYLFYNKKILKNPGNYVLPFTLYATLISLIFSPIGLDAILRGLAYWLVALIVFSAYKKSYQRESVTTSQLLLGLILLCLLINSLYIFIPGTAGRFSGVMGNPNELGLLSIFSYGLLDLLKKKGETGYAEKYFLIAKVILIFLVILSGSRTSLFGLILYELILRLFNNKPILIFALLISIMIYYLSLSIDPVAVVKALGLSEYLRVDTLTTGSGRTEVWEVAWEEIKESPWIGKGILYDNYFITDYRRNYLGANPARHWYGIWNSYLSLLLDVGIIGFIMYFFFVFRLLNLSQYKNLAVAFLVMVAFAGITESWMAASLNAFTPLFFLYWAIQAEPVKEILEE